MANLYSSLEETHRPLRPSLTPSTDSQRQEAQAHQSMSEPTFSPTGLLGDRYDLLRQEMEERSRAATQRPRENPFNGGLLGALDEYENQQVEVPRGQITSSDTWGVGAGLSRAPSRRSYHGCNSTTSVGYVIHGTTKTTVMARDEWSWRKSLHWSTFIDAGGKLENLMGHFYFLEQKPFDGCSSFRRRKI
ncbi:unnamed protein product [Fusarium venenatum]|uniref:Uncharacterized protein n=1 Tax=Fusarium venenatum TaxID=56646 RepID=A0A2L2TE34_9HYPO|nr:uncharacterized protein FVRRES_02805 [Fusarium venenatum]CEI66293.1 unnamed protein product [Fusarium venenatum]